MRKETLSKKIQSPYPILAIGVFWLVYAIYFSLYRLKDYIILILLSIILYLGLRHFAFKDVEESYVVEIPSENPAFDTLQTMCLQHIQNLKTLNLKIDNEGISSNLNDICITLQSILDYLEKHPHQIESMNKFLTYYLPTIQKLLKTYDHYDNQLQSKEISDTLLRIEQSLSLFNQGLKEKYNQLTDDQMIDAKAEISVLETMLNNDGLINDMKEG